MGTGEGIGGTCRTGASRTHRTRREKRPRDIEALLGWAYRGELAKLQWLGLEARFGFAAMPSRLGPDRNNGYPASTPFFDTLVPIDGGRPPTDEAGPHPDAVRIGLAVDALDGGVIADEIAADPRKLFSDMPAHVQAEAPEALKGYLPRLATQVSNIMVRAARMGSRPDWHVEVPELKLRAAPNGGQPLWFVMAERVMPTIDGGTIVTPMEVDGYDRVKHRPKPGAYRKYYFDPDPRLVIDERADYRAWAIALKRISAAVAGELVEHEALPPKAEEWPWSAP